MRTMMFKNMFGKVNIWFILFIAILLRLPLLNSSFWLDEAAQALESSRPLSQQLMIKEDFQPPLMHLIVYFLALISHAEWWLRLSSLGAGLITIWATYTLIHLLGQRRIALLTAFFLSINSFHIFYSQELRPYSLTAMWAALGWMLVIKMTKHSVVKKPILLSFVFTTIAGLYSTYLYPFAFFGQLLFLVARRKKQYLIQAGITLIVSTFVFLPWLPFLKQQLDVSSDLRLRTPNWETVVSTPQIKALQLVFGKFVFGVIDLDVNIAFVTLTLILIGTMACLTWYNRRHLGIYAGLMICCWFVLPVFFVWGFSFFLPILQPKRVLYTLPAFSFFVSSLIIYGRQLQKTKLLAGLLFLVMLCIQIYGTLSYYLNPQYHREDWRTLIANIDKNFDPSNSIIVFGFDHPFSPWDWYDHKPFQTISTGTGTKTEYYQIRAPMRQSLEYDTVIVFDYLRDLTDPNRFVETWLTTYNYSQSELLSDPHIGFVRVFRKGGTFANRPTQRNN